MNVLSLFDGMSCGQIALNRAGIKYDNYFASEIDKHAIKVTMSNYPDTIQLGDVTQVKSKNLPKIDLFIGGSPCQGFSFAGKQLNFNDVKSKLFFEYVRLLKECNPKYFLLENVKMKKEFESIISEYLGIRPIEINSALVSAQNRKRLYWTNIPNVMQPEDKHINLKNILQKKDFNNPPHNNKFKQTATQSFLENKHKCLLANAGDRTQGIGIHDHNLYWRKLTPIECERLQTVPDNYTNYVSDRQRYKMLGNCWTVDVVVHIFKGIQRTLHNSFYKKLESPITINVV
jgi:site-specific DNA-cytosine methylase